MFIGSVFKNVNGNQNLPQTKISLGETYSFQAIVSDEV